MKVVGRIAGKKGFSRRGIKNIYEIQKDVIIVNMYYTIIYVNYILNT